MAKIATSAVRKDPNRTSLANPRPVNRLSSDARQKVESLAYQFFVGRGYKHGFDREDWLRAEAIVKSGRFA